MFRVYLEFTQVGDEFSHAARQIALIQYGVGRMDQIFPKFFPLVELF